VWHGIEFHAVRLKKTVGELVEVWQRSTLWEEETDQRPERDRVAALRPAVRMSHPA